MRASLLLLLGLALAACGAPQARPLPTATTVPTSRPPLAATAVSVIAAASPTPSLTATPAPTDPPSATPAPSRTPAPRPTSTPAPESWYVASAQAVNARASASTDAAVIAQLAPGSEVPGYGQASGTSVNGSAIWYEVLVNGQRAYVHSSLLSRTRPAAPASQAQSPVQNSPSPAVPAASTQPGPPPGAACPGFEYTCSQLTCPQAYACLAAGNIQLDGNKDGIPCNAQCR